MTAIPTRPDHIPETMYKRCGDIIVDDFVWEIDENQTGFWKCDKCEDWGGSIGNYREHPEQLYLWDIPFEETDGYRFGYFMAQQHYEWAHEGAFARTSDLTAEEFDEFLDELIASEETEPQTWLDPWRKTKYERFCEYFGIETYHGKHRLEDHLDMPAARSVENLFWEWHRACEKEYSDFPALSWQKKAWFWSRLNLARGYHPYKRKRHSK